MLVIREHKTCCLNFNFPKDVENNLKDEIKFIKNYY